MALAFRPTAWSHRAISAILGLFWLFAGAVYHLTFFREINPLAVVFGAAFVVQGLLLLGRARRAGGSCSRRAAPRRP